VNRGASPALKLRSPSFRSRDSFLVAAWRAVELRAEAARLRDFARTVFDEYVLAEIETIAKQLEDRAQDLSNGGVTSDKAKPEAWTLI
jgi:hypothetical protein